MAHTRGKMGVNVIGRVLKEAKASASPSSLFPCFRSWAWGGGWGWGCWETAGGEVVDDSDGGAILEWGKAGFKCDWSCGWCGDWRGRCVRVIKQGVSVWCGLCIRVDGIC